MTLKDLRKLYSSFRRRYFQGDPLPKAKDIKFRWAGEEEILNLKSELACTIWESGSVTIAFHPLLRGPWMYRLAVLVLLHEMAHVKNPKADHGPWFQEEAVRLGSLGAMRDFWV